MKVLASANESTFNSQRKYLRWPSQVLAFFGVLIIKNTIGIDEIKKGSLHNAENLAIFFSH